MVRFLLSILVLFLFSFLHQNEYLNSRFLVYLGDSLQYRGTYQSESPSLNRSTKLNIDQPASNVSNPSSPQPARHLSPTSQASSLTNPF